MIKKITLPLEIELINLDSKDSKAEILVFDYFEKLGFNINRFYFLRGIQPGTRGNHTHKNCFQIIVAISNSSILDITQPGGFKQTFELVPLKNAVIIPPNFRIELKLEKQAICLALSSETFKNTITTI